MAYLKFSVFILLIYFGQIQTLRNSQNNFDNKTKGPRFACPSEWTKLTVGCYKFIQNVDYYSATKRCKKDGGYLAQVNTQREQNALWKFYIDSGLPQTKVEHTSQVWIGANDMKKEGNFVWDNSGKIVMSSAWKQGEPNGGRSQNCVQAWGWLNFKFVDEDCGYKSYALCEYEKTDWTTTWRPTPWTTTWRKPTWTTTWTTPTTHRTTPTTPWTTTWRKPTWTTPITHRTTPTTPWTTPTTPWTTPTTPWTTPITPWTTPTTPWTIPTTRPGPTPRCICINPWEGTVDSHLGDPDKMCRTDGHCYVECDYGCRDQKASKAGAGVRCTSEVACDGSIAAKETGQKDELDEE